jgi:hypothetical protein
MCLDRGAKPSISEFKERVHKRNMDNLSVWHNVGEDAENGQWATYGARLGTYLTMLDNWDHTQVQDFDQLGSLWTTYSDTTHYSDDFLYEIATALETQLGLPMLWLNAESSRFFKHHYRSNFTNKGIMVRDQ